MGKKHKEQILFLKRNNRKKTPIFKAKRPVISVRKPTFYDGLKICIVFIVIIQKFVLLIYTKQRKIEKIKLFMGKERIKVKT